MPWRCFVNNEAVDALHAEVTRVSEADPLADAHGTWTHSARHETLRTLLVDEQRWLQKTEAQISQVRAWREQDARLLADRREAVARNAAPGAGDHGARHPVARWRGAPCGKSRTPILGCDPDFAESLGRTHAGTGPWPESGAAARIRPLCGVGALPRSEGSAARAAG